MKNKITQIRRLFTVLLFIGGINSTAWSQSITPVITEIGNSGPACVDGTITLNASGTVGGVSSSSVRMAGIGANAGNRSFNQVFSSGDRAGSIDRISMVQFDAIFAGQPNNAAKAAALKAKYDVLMFTWASPIDYNITWGLITAYLETGGSVFVDGDYANITRFNDGTPNSIVGSGGATTGGCNYTLVSPAPFPSLVANGVNGCFANDHLFIQSFPSWMKSYIVASGRHLAVAGIYPGGNNGRLIVQGPDQDYHALRGGNSIQANQYQIMLNQMDFLSANQAGFTWSGPNGFTSNEANPVISNVTAANAGVYTATLTNMNGGASASATTTVTVNIAEIPEITVSGTTDLCPGSTVTLTASEGGSYLWNTGATTQSIVVSSQGNYSVQVAGTNGCVGTSAATTVNVNVIYCNQPPVIAAKALDLSADGDCSANTIASDFDNGTTDPDGDDITFTVSPVGPYSIGETAVVLTATDSQGASSSISTTVIVKDTTLPTAIAQNISINLDANGSAVITVSDIDNGSSDACGIASIIIDKTDFDCSNLGANTVTLTVTDNNGNVSTATASVNVNDVTAPTVITQNISVTLVDGMATITPEDVNNGSFDNCAFTLSLDNNSFSCSDIGSNTVTLTATDASNNTTSMTAVVEVVGDVPTIAINDFYAVQTQKANTIFLGFGPQSINLSTVVTGGSGFTYEWTTSTGEVVSNEANPSISPTVSTTYNVTVTNSNGCTASTSLYVCVIDARAFDNKGRYNGKVVVCHHTNGKKGTKHVQIEISPSAVMTHLTQHGVGTGHADTLGACDATCVDASSAKSQSVETVSISDNLLVYPNPSNGIFDVQLRSVELDTNISLFNLAGQLIESKVISKENSFQNIITIGNHNLSSGVYILKIENQNESVIKKVVIN